MEHVTGDRWDVIVRLLGSPDSVLDIGCRDKALQRHLPATVRYVGVDLGPPADVIASAETPLPFEDNAFDVTVLTDVLEHLNDPHRALREAARVAKTGVVVLLPNLFFYKVRLLMLAGRLGTDKYDMVGAHPAEDRHRWFVHFNHARSFVRDVAESAGWEVAREVAYDGGPRHPATRATTAVLKKMTTPGVWAYEYGARLEPSRRVR